MFSRHLLLLLIVGVVSSVEAQHPRGVPLSKIQFYKENKPFTCVDGSRTISFDRVNDDYCDCKDGSDEPGTAACPNGRFYCTNVGFRPSFILSSRVNDGICDCCDTTDEYNSDASCQNTCRELGQKELQVLQKKAHIAKQGFLLKQQLVQKAKKGQEEKQSKLKELQASKRYVEETVKALRTAKETAEQPEKEAKDQHLKAWEDQKVLIQMEKDKARMAKAFLELDRNADDFVSMAELLSHIELNPNLQGSLKRAKALLGGFDKVDIAGFETMWSSNKENTLGLQNLFFAAPHAAPVDAQADSPVPLEAPADSASPVEVLQEDVKEPVSNSDSDVPIEETRNLVKYNVVNQSSRTMIHERRRIEEKDDDYWEDEEDIDGWTPEPDIPLDEQDDTREYEDEDDDEDDEEENEKITPPKHSHEKKHSEDDTPLDGQDMTKEYDMEDLEEGDEKIPPPKHIHVKKDDEPMPPYDEDTQKLIDAAQKARDEFEDAERALGEMDDQMSRLEKELSLDFGPSAEFSYLYSECYESSSSDYVYKFCPFNNVSQKPKYGGSETNLGSWGSWAGPDGDIYSEMKYDHGTGCFQGPNRSTTVKLTCGMETLLQSTSEPSHCEYLMEFITPAVCHKPQSMDSMLHTHDEL